jgi:hypothetical protein
MAVRRRIVPHMRQLPAAFHPIVMLVTSCSQRTLSHKQYTMHTQHANAQNEPVSMPPM